MEPACTESRQHTPPPAATVRPEFEIHTDGVTHWTQKGTGTDVDLYQTSPSHPCNNSATFTASRWGKAPTPTPRRQAAAAAPE